MTAVTASASSDRQAAIGEVYLVGAGPGDPELLTVKALRLIQQADVVVYDRLVSHGIMALIGDGTEKIYAGKERSNHVMRQKDINDLLVNLARRGKKVVRLKGGDPFVFGRGGEEIATLMQEQIRFQVVPGITAALGCAAYSGIPLTHRDYSQTCLFIPGHLQDGSDEIDWGMLVRPHQTLVFYMGLIRLQHICRQLIAHGMSAQTPAALIAHGTLPEQRVLKGQLSGIYSLTEDSHITPPTILIVGEVVRLRDSLQWYHPAG